MEIVTTTSLYGKSSQYNRLKVRANQFQELPYNLFWEELGFTEGQGTFNFSNNTSLKLNRFFTERLGYRHINNKFGEGTGAKMRKLRSAINLLGINEEKLIEHSQKRNFLAAKLTPDAIENLWNFKQKKISKKVPFAVICSVWIERWVKNRIQNREILDMIKAETFEKLLSGILFEDDTEVVFSDDSQDQPKLI